MDQLPWPLIGAGAGWTAFVGLAFLIARLVANGDWVPRSTHERELEAARHDSNEWRTEGRIKDQAIIATLDDIKATSEETGKSLHAYLAALQDVISKGREVS